MNRKSGSDSGSFLMEILVVVGFFTICVSICVLVFVKAGNISKDARDINQAVLEAQSPAEELKAGQSLRWPEMFPDRNTWEHLIDADGEDREQAEQNQELVQNEGYAGIHTMHWSNSWEETEPNNEPPFLGIIYTGTVDKTKRADILIMRYARGSDKGRLLYRPQTEIYAQPQENTGPAARSFTCSRWQGLRLRNIQPPARFGKMKHGKERQITGEVSRSKVNIGAPSLILIFIILCMATFGLLSISGVQDDLKLAGRDGEAVRAHYEANSRGQWWLKEVGQVLTEEMGEKRIPPSAAWISRIGWESFTTRRAVLFPRTSPRTGDSLCALSWFPCAVKNITIQNHGMYMPVMSIKQIIQCLRGVEQPHSRNKTEAKGAKQINVTELPISAAEQNTADIFLIPGMSFSYKISGRITYQGDSRIISDEMGKMITEIYGLIKNRDMDKVQSHGDDDPPFAIPGMSRFRASVLRQRGSLAGIIRVVRFELPDTGQLHLPDSTIDVSRLTKGMVLVIGPVDSGRSMTLACIIDEINSTRSAHVITLEDPIEYLHRHKRSVVTQRKVTTDTDSYVTGPRASLCQAPGVILLGETRDYETISIAMTAAEIGHLIPSALHTVEAANTTGRTIGAFSPSQQQQIRTQLAMVLDTAISQQLIPTMDGGVQSAFEIIFLSNAIRNMVRESKIHQIDGVIVTSQEEGMVSMDNSLIKLHRDGVTSHENVATYSSNSELTEKKLAR